MYVGEIAKRASQFVSNLNPFLISIQYIWMVYEGFFIYSSRTYTLVTDEHGK